MAFKVSVILPFYNKENTARKTLNSLIKQTIFDKIELICVDDCSTDNTFKIINEYAQKYKNISAYQNEKNRSVYYSRKRAIRYATGEYIGFIDPDDWVDESYYEELYDAGIRYDADIVQTRSIVMYMGKDKNGQPKYAYDKAPLFVGDCNNGLLFLNPETLRANLWDCPSAIMWHRIFKASLIKKCDRLPPFYIRRSSDVVFVFDCLFRAKTLLTINTASNYYYDSSNEVQHLTNSTNKQPIKRDDSLATVFSIIDTLLIENNAMKYLDFVKHFRTNRGVWLTNKYNSLFRKVENFDGSICYYIPRHKLAEAEELKQDINFLIERNV